MSNSTLMGSNFVTEAEVIAVPDVPWTKSFHPIPHKDFVKVMEEAVTAVGIGITEKQYILNNNGMKMFSVWQLDQGDSAMKWSIGLRNSTDKSLSLGIVAGSTVLVCSNLAFSGEFLAFRKHTSGLDIDTLAFMAFRAVRQMIPRLKQFQLWHHGLRNYSLADVDMKILLVKIMTDSVIPASKFHSFNELYHNVYDNTLWGFHEACTDVLKGSNLLALPKKNLLLNRAINSYIDSLDTAHPSPLGDFYQQRALTRV